MIAVDYSKKLSHVIDSGNVRAFKRVFQKIQVNRLSKMDQSEFITTLLRTAASCGRLQIVNELLAFKPVVGGNETHQTIKHFAPDSCKGNTVLHSAAIKGRLNIVKRLLELPDVEINAQNNSGNTALICATVNGYVKVVRCLLKVDGINVNLRNVNETACLHYAVGNNDIVKELLSFDGIDIGIVDDDGRTLLHYAAVLGHPSTIQLLLETVKATAIVNAQDNNKTTPLTTAILSGKSHIVL